MGRVAHRVSVSTLLLFPLFLAACTSSSTSVTSPTSVRCPLDLALSPPTVGAAGGSGQITIAVNRDCTWEARSETEWIALTPPTTGQGEATISYTAASNAVVSARRGAVVVNDQRVEIAQAAAACVFALGAPGGAVGASGGTLGVTVTAQASCVWAAVSQASWIQIDAGREGNGQGAVSMRVDANTDAARQGTILIAGQLYTVSQAAVPPPPPPPGTPPPVTPPPVSPPPVAPPPVSPTPPTPTPPAPPTCTFDVSPTSESVRANGGDRDVRVRTGSSCTWTAVSLAPWISLSVANGNGNGQARYVVAPNTGTARNGALTVAGTTVTVTQEAAAPEPISLQGRISDLSGRCPNLTFRLEGRIVRTNDATSIQGNCDRLRDRREVEVTGLVQPDGSVLALRLRRGNDDDDNGQAGQP